MDWLLFTSQLPANPSSLRVMVWRRMKSAGAVGLQNGVWVLPASAENTRFLEELIAYLIEQGAAGQAFSADPLNPAVADDLVAQFMAQADEEYTELIERGNEMLAELDKETGRGKFTFAELEENEADLNKLTGWFEKIQGRDHFGGTLAKDARRKLKACQEAMERFAERVYAEEGVTSPDD